MLDIGNRSVENWRATKTSYHQRRLRQMNGQFYRMSGDETETEILSESLIERN